MPKTWLITGCSSGFGKELTESGTGPGDRLVATARKLEALDALGRPISAHGADGRARRDQGGRTLLPPSAWRRMRLAGSTCWSTMPGSGSSPRSRKVRRTSTGRCSRPMFSA